MQQLQKQTFRLILILLVSLSLYWAMNLAQNTQRTVPDIKQLKDREVKPSAFLKNSTFYLYNSKGQVSEIRAHKAYFYSNTEYIKIDQPSFSSAPDNKAGYTLTARSGDYHPTDETLLLSGDVKAEQRTNETLVWTLESEQLLLDYKTGSLTTDTQVLISHGQHYLSSLGLEAQMNERVLKLLSNVRGKYVFEN